MRGRTAVAAVALAGLVAAPACAQTWRTVTSARQVQGERRLDVELEYGAGRLTVRPATGNLLYRMEVRYDQERTRPVTEYDRAAGRLRLGVEGTRRRGMRGLREGGRATFALSPRVASELHLAFGAGEADVELGGLALTGLQVETGASETRIAFSSPNRTSMRTLKLEAGAASLRATGLGNARADRIEFEGGVGEATLDFGGTWTRSATAAVEMGLGSLTLRLPRDVGVRIEKDSFLASFDAPGMVKRGNAWFSRNWESARYKLDLSIDAALGSIDIEWIG
jgi:hypothetical protein